jgi:nitrite reductase (NADH) small subunit
MPRFPLDIPAGLSESAGAVVSVGSKTLALFSVGGEIHAIDNVCPHRGGPLGEGHLEGSVVRCPFHSWAFDVKTGSCVGRPGVGVPRYPVLQEGDRHWVEIPD